MPKKRTKFNFPSKLKKFERSNSKIEKRVLAVRDQMFLEMDRIKSQRKKIWAIGGQIKFKISRMDRFYSWLHSEWYNSLLGSSIPHKPHINMVDQSSISPGSQIIIYGVGFAGSGRVLLKLSQNTKVDLIISSWSPTRIVATLSGDLDGLYEYPNGAIWIISDNGLPKAGDHASNPIPMGFVPLYDYWWAKWWRLSSPGLFGLSTDGVANDGKYLDQGFTLENVQTEDVSGNTYLKAPNPGGDDLAQGYHMGMADDTTIVGFWNDPYPSPQDASLQIIYQISGPKGIAPTNFPYTTYLGDNDHNSSINMSSWVQNYSDLPWAHAFPIGD